ncbi:MAG: ABC transporter permease [Anaerolineales bacterium]
MRALFLIASNVYRRRIRSGSFLLLTFGLPLIMLVAAAVPILQLSKETNSVLAVVDQTGELKIPPEISIDDRSIDVVTYPDEAQARQATSAGELEGYLLIPADFPVERPIYYGLEEPGISTESGLAQVLQRAIAPGQPDWVYYRLDNAAVVSYQALDGSRVDEGFGLIVWVATPAVLALMYVLAVFTGAGQMGGALIQERDERALEMVITSIRPAELVLGKVLGFSLVSLTQLAVWTAGGVGAVLLYLFSRQEPIALHLPWTAIFWGLALGLPSYLLFAFTGAGLGIVAGEGTQARQLSGVLGFLGMAPVWLLGLVVQQPGGTLAVGLTLFPFSATSIALFRMVLSAVPTWQLWTSLAITLVCLLISGWVLTRLFRTVMLLTGQRASISSLWRAARESGGAS